VNPEVESVAVLSVSNGGRSTLVGSAGSGVADDEMLRSAVAARTQVSRQVSRDGRRQWQIVHPIFLNGTVVGVIALSSSLRAADLIARQNRLRALLVGPLSVALVVLLVRLGFRRLVHRPLIELQEAMHLAEKGDMMAEAKVIRRDELGGIASSYNNMLAQLRSAAEEREKLLLRLSRFNDELSTQVAVATKELQETNWELRTVNGELYYMQRRLARIERLTVAEQMATRLAHKIGTPLNLISGHIQVLRQAWRGEHTLQDEQTLQEKLLMISSQIEKVTIAVREMLDETRKPLVEKSTLDLNRLLRQIFALVEPTLATRAIESRLELSNEPASIRGDENQLEEVFLSLLHNSLDAMPHGGTITVKTAHVDSKVQVRFSDTGEGIPEEALTQLFRPLFTTKEIGRGTGMGLAIAKEILTAHDGNIVAESSLGHGTTFIIELPAVPVTEKVELAINDSYPGS
jgi:signal transduction histidine kinase